MGLTFASAATGVKEGLLDMGGGVEVGEQTSTQGQVSGDCQPLRGTQHPARTAPVRSPGCGGQRCLPLIPAHAGVEHGLYLGHGSGDLE